MSDQDGKAVRVLFVCLGNICRSPTAEGVFRALVAREEPEIRIETDSAGTGGWHLGNPPDPRAVAAAAQRGIDISDLRARQVRSEDFRTFDHILAMDRSNLRALRDLSGDSGTRPRLLLEFGPGGEVPDPYYGGEDGFEQVLDMIEMASAGLLRAIRAGRT